jgi:hypothetical protein
MVSMGTRFIRKRLLRAASDYCKVENKMNVLPRKAVFEPVLKATVAFLKVKIEPLK